MKFRNLLLIFFFLASGALFGQIPIAQGKSIFIGSAYSSGRR